MKKSQFYNNFVRGSSNQNSESEVMFQLKCETTECEVVLALISIVYYSFLFQTIIYVVLEII